VLHATDLYAQVPGPLLRVRPVRASQPSNYVRYMQETAFDASAAVGYSMARYATMDRYWLVHDTEVEYSPRCATAIQWRLRRGSSISNMCAPSAPTSSTGQALASW